MKPESPWSDEHRALLEKTHLLEDIAAALKGYRFEQEKNLKTYRSQRAWKAMLLFRMAYTLLIKPGLKAKARLIKSVLKGGLAAGLKESELYFPDVLSYLPEEVHSLIHAARSPWMTQEADGCAATYDVLVLPVFEFEYRYQRPQQLAAEFARTGHRVFWISPSHVLPRNSNRLYETVPLRRNLWEVRLRRRPADVFRDRIKEEDVETISLCLAQFIREWAVAENCAMLQLPYWRQAGLALRRVAGSMLHYDCMDDWQSMPRLSAFNRSEEAALVRECDLFTVSSQRLRDIRERDCGRTGLVVRNATGFGHFSADYSVSRPADSPASVPAWARPVIGYFGEIAEWFDCRLLTRVAKSRPQYTFVLIGPTDKEQQTPGMAELKILPNVHFPGPLDYREMPFSLAGFDVCIIPFVLNEVTQATDPVKFYEYLSRGKPIVATRMGELVPFADLLYLAEDPDEFAVCLDKALAEDDKELQQRRIGFARGNTWPDRVQAIDEALRNLFPLVSILIVTHNSGEFIGPCLDSIRRSASYPNYEVIVVDNGSTDKTVKIVTEYAADAHLQVIRGGNTGFSAGNNLAAGHAKGEYLILLNADTIVIRGWVERLLWHCRSDQSAGVVVPVTNSAGNEVKINVDYRNCAEMEEFGLGLSRRNWRKSIEIAVAPLFCALVPRAVWQTVGKLDERFETGMFEDDDFSLRVRNAGYRILAAEDCFVHHFGSGSFSQLSPSCYESLFERNRQRFEEKWNTSWVPHSYRAGIRPQSGHFTPDDFFAAGQRKAAPERLTDLRRHRQTPAPPILHR